MLDDDVLAFSPAEAGRRLGIHRRSVVRAIQRGELRAVRLGRRVLVPRAEIERLLGAVAAHPELAESNAG